MSFSRFFIIWGPFLGLLGLFRAPFGASASLACTFCGLWHLQDYFLNHIRPNLEEFIDSSFHALPLLGELRWCWGCGLKVIVRRLSFFILSSGLPVPMRRQLSVSILGHTIFNSIL